MRHTTATHNPVVGLFIHATTRGSRAAWLAYLTTNRQARQQKQRWLGERLDESGTPTNTLALIAIVKALHEVKSPATVIVHTDNKYLMRAVSEWLPTWKSNGWLNVKGAPVANAELWKQIAAWSEQPGNTLKFRFPTDSNTVSQTIDSLRRKTDERLAS